MSAKELTARLLGVDARSFPSSEPIRNQLCAALEDRFGASAFDLMLDEGRQTPVRQLAEMTLQAIDTLEP